VVPWCLCTPPNDEELRDIRAICSGPWLVADFNLTYHQAEDKNNANINRALMGHFRGCFFILCLGLANIH
jgi:hypothetical protein